MTKFGLLCLSIIEIAAAASVPDSEVIAIGKMSSHTYSEFNIRDNKDVSITNNIKEFNNFKLVRFNGKYYCNLIIGNQELEPYAFLTIDSGKMYSWRVFVNLHTGCCVRVQHTALKEDLVMVIDMTAFNMHIFYGKLSSVKKDFF